jgi:hypothetical protein
LACDHIALDEDKSDNSTYRTRAAMSSRARQARRLASILIKASGVHTSVQYDRADGRYTVHWQGGPSAETMRELAAQNAPQVPLLSVDALLWVRTEPSQHGWPWRSPRT